MWQQELPKQDGFYWTRWKRKDGNWTITPAEIVSVGEDRLVYVANGGTFPVHAGVKLTRAKKAFGWSEITFWPTRLDKPDGPMVSTARKIMADSRLEKRSRLIDRLHNYKFKSALKYISSTDKDAAEIVRYLAAQYGDCGWIDGGVSILINAAIKSITGTE